MKNKILNMFIMFLLLTILFPTIVFAGGSSDDNSDSMGLSHMNINCVYEQQTYFPVTSGNLVGNGIYVNFEFVGIDAVQPGTSFTFSHGLKPDKTFEFRDEYTFGSGFNDPMRWLNYNLGYGSEYNLQAWWLNQMMGEDFEILPASEIQSKADNGDFCPSQIIVAYDGDKRFFVSARDDDDREKSVHKLIQDKYESLEYYFFTGTTLVISNINQDSYEDTNAEEKVEESKETIKDKCDETSPNYNEAECIQHTIVGNETEKTAENIVSYNPTTKVELPGIALGKVTCDSLFKNEIGNYNSTWQLLSTTLRFMQYLGIILATVLSIVDFVKVVPTQDKDAINKAAKKAVTRLIIAIVIFFVPIILDFILDLVILLVVYYKLIRNGLKNVYHFFFF